MFWPTLTAVLTGAVLIALTVGLYQIWVETQPVTLQNGRVIERHVADACETNAGTYNIDCIDAAERALGIDSRR